VLIKNLLLISSLLSLLVGTIAGLSQIKVKRLLAFSSISHVGFLLLALGIYTQKSVDSFIFYLVQYSITSLNIFLILLAFGYLISPSLRATLPAPSLTGKAREGLNPMDYQANSSANDNSDINYLIELKGQLYKNPVLSISLAICLFSMAGIPPLIGFFSKQFVLFSSIENGNNFLSIVAILVSVISASYYLRLIKITFFDSLGQASQLLALHKKDSFPAFALQPEGEFSLSARQLNKSVGEVNPYNGDNQAPIQVTATPLHSPIRYLSLTNYHSYTIAILTFLILFFFLDPSILLNGTQLISLTIFNI